MFRRPISPCPACGMTRDPLTVGQLEDMLAHLPADARAVFRLGGEILQPMEIHSLPRLGGVVFELEPIRNLPHPGHDKRTSR